LPNLKGQKGSGIGLSFVREVAKLHGGTVNIENIQNGGVCAIVKIQML
jgi:two-component system sensor histidine kinase CreC